MTKKIRRPASPVREQVKAMRARSRREAIAAGTFGAQRAVTIPSKRRVASKEACRRPVRLDELEH